MFGDLWIEVGMLERFFYLIHVNDTTSLTLKREIPAVFFFHHCLDIQNLCGQGYNGASSMHGEWNGLQALFFKIVTMHIIGVLGF